MGNVRSNVIYAAQRFLTHLFYTTIKCLMLALEASYVVFAVLASCVVALATIIRSAVGVRGSKFMNSVWSVICRLKALNFDVRS